MAREHSLSTPSGTITIAQAQPSDIDIVISILEEAGYICRGEIVFQGKQQVWKTSLYEKNVQEKIDE